MKIYTLGQPLCYVIIGEESAVKARVDIIQAGLREDHGFDLDPCEFAGLDALEELITSSIIWVVATKDAGVQVSEEVARRMFGRPRAALARFAPMDWTIPVG